MAEKERYHSDESDEEWAFVAPYLTLMTRLPETLAGLHLVAFVMVFTARFIQLTHFLNPVGCGCL